jgi:hypothetical protein
MATMAGLNGLKTGIRIGAAVDYCQNGGTLTAAGTANFAAGACTGGLDSLSVLVDSSGPPTPYRIATAKALHVSGITFSAFTDAIKSPDNNPVSRIVTGLLL